MPFVPAFGICGFDITQHTFAEFLQWANEVDPKDLGFIKEGIEMNPALPEPARVAPQIGESRPT